MTRTAIILAALAMLAGCNGQPEDASGGNAQASPTPVQTGGATSAPTAAGWERKVTRTPEGGVLFGNPDARHKLVEYGARTCPACAKFTLQAAEPLMRDYVARGDVSYEFRDFLVHGAPDLAAALVGHCGPLERFAANLESDYRHQEEAMTALQSIPESDVRALEGQPPAKVITLLAERGGYVDRAARLGLPRDKALACLADDAAMKALANRTRDADPKIVDATPTFLLDGTKLAAHDWAGVRNAIDAVR